MPSLTLHDPDMILPYEGERESQTPSPPQIAYLSHLNSRNYDPNAPMAVGSRQKKNFSRSAWTHEDVNVSRRLSDIGEELSPARSDNFETGDSHESSSPDEHEAESSSSSTVSAGSRRASETRPVDRDLAAAQAEVVKAQASVVGASPTLAASNSVASAAAEGKGPGEEFSSAILSSEAERILENAKKRLNLMEGNLTRARSTTRMTPSPSPSTPGNIPMGMHHPVGGLYRSISRTDPKNSSLRRQSLISNQDSSNNRHSRVHSETNIPSESSMSNDKKGMSRSVSAMGASTSSSLHTDDRSFQYEPTRAYLTHRASISSIRPPVQIQEQPAEPETTPSPISDGNSLADSPQSLGISDEESKSSPDSFSPVYSSFGPPSRAQSQLQVRDLQYQMKGLHIKISSLKVKTQEDNLRRRSLQSLRTPSPLTAADHWYANALELKDGRSSRGSNPRRDTSSEYARRVSNAGLQNDRRASGDSPVEHQAENASTNAGNWQDNGPEYDDNQSVAETMYEDAEEGDYDEIDREALDEILREPLDDDLEGPIHIDTTPHEMREDAFDYEHFILHSALGNFARPLRRASTSSNGSIETTRPTYTAKHSRTNSAMSDSTVATFATATEGRRDDEDDIDSVMYWDRRFNHGPFPLPQPPTEVRTNPPTELRHGHGHGHAHTHSHSHHGPSPIQEAQEPDRSETPRGSRANGDNTLTPVDEVLTPQKQTGRSSTAGTATPNSLVSSLVSTVRAASSTPVAGGINDDDTQMLETLFASLGNVCMDLQAITTSPEPDHNAARVLRRRLDAARRVLEGELDA
ncbi:uncharacterized protein N7511_004699 [Penicillium nucicola]|uniref:uncharacterized protein n=1 Tax=Penicillium nucicola TaxID=1850975 RepID=UPI002544E8AA|nr:uncharacterized protein N7511_004699 [Penicillium nucicola]KAJ5767083.1 hypothetical protein N7511_004699 [Penicillium nucicola]